MRDRKLGKKLVLKKRVVRKLASQALHAVKGGTGPDEGGPIALASMVGCTVKVTMKQSGGCA